MTKKDPNEVAREARARAEAAQERPNAAVNTAPVRPADPGVLSGMVGAQTGEPGPSGDEADAKDTTVAGTAQFDPRPAPPADPTVTSAPPNQPIAGTPQPPPAAVAPTPDDITRLLDQIAGAGPSVQAAITAGLVQRGLLAAPSLPGRSSQVVENQRVRALKTAYYNDAIRNEGEIVEGYSGPLGSVWQPIDDKGEPIKV